MGSMDKGSHSAEARGPGAVLRLVASATTTPKAETSARRHPVMNPRDTPEAPKETCHVEKTQIEFQTSSKLIIGNLIHIQDPKFVSMVKR